MANMPISFLGKSAQSHGQCFTSQNGNSFSLIPHSDAEYVLRMDMHTDELKLVGPRMTEGENKFQNGFVGRDGCVYGKQTRRFITTAKLA